MSTTTITAGQLPAFSEPLAVQRDAYEATRRRIDDVRDRLELQLSPEALTLVRELASLHNDAEILYGRTCTKEAMA